MKLYTVPLAPNPMRVTLYLAERAALGAKISLETVIVNTLKGQHREPEHLPSAHCRCSSLIPAST